MVKIWALVIESDDEENILLYWRQKDAIDDLSCIIGEMVEDEAVAAKAVGMLPDTDKAFRYLDKQAEVSFVLSEVPVEGTIDGVMLKKFEKAVKGPREVMTIQRKPKAAMKVAAAGGCRTVINGVEV